MSCTHNPEQVVSKLTAIVPLQNAGEDCPALTINLVVDPKRPLEKSFKVSDADNFFERQAGQYI